MKMKKFWAEAPLRSATAKCAILTGFTLGSLKDFDVPLKLIGLEEMIRTASFGDILIGQRLFEMHVTDQESTLKFCKILFMDGTH